MCGDEPASEALLELADVVVRDGVGSDALVFYLERRLSIELIEPHASCRTEAAWIAASRPGLSPEEVAVELCRAARNAQPSHVRRPLAVRFRDEQAGPVKPKLIIRVRCLLHWARKVLTRRQRRASRIRVGDAGSEGSADCT